MKIATRLAKIDLIERGTGKSVQLQSLGADRTKVRTRRADVVEQSERDRKTSRESCSGHFPAE